MATHVTVGTLAYSALFWNSLHLLMPTFGEIAQSDAIRIRRVSMFMLPMLLFTMMFGGTVGATDGGKVFNTFPYMNSVLLPSDYWQRTPKWRNFFENTATTQFNHRYAGYLTYGGMAYLFYLSRKLALPMIVRRSILVMFILVNLQAILGITMVLKQVPPTPGVMHQINGFTILTLLLLTMHCVKKPNAEAFKVMGKISRFYRH